MEKHIDMKQIKSDVEEKVNEVFLKHQEMLGIKSGDINPFDQIDLDSAIEDLSNIIAKVLKYEFNYTEGH